MSWLVGASVPLHHPGRSSFLHALIWISIPLTRDELTIYNGGRMSKIHDAQRAQLDRDERLRMKVFGANYEPFAGWSSPGERDAYLRQLNGVDSEPDSEVVARVEADSDPSAPNPSPAPKQNRKDTEHRRWVLTLPASEYDQDYLETHLGKYKAVIGQLEVAPTTGYRHWQLYLESKSAIRFSTMGKLFPKGHYEAATETRIAGVKYATREDKRAPNTPILTIGQFDFTVTQGKRTDLDSYAEQIMLEGKSADEVIFDDHRAVKYENQLRSLELIRDRKSWGVTFRNIEVHYIHGETRTGKTSSIHQTYGYTDVYRVSNWRNPFDGYKGQDVLVLDEYTTSVPMVDMLKILEGYPLEVAARYTDKIAKFTKVFIVSNVPLDRQHKTIQQEHPEQWAAFKARLTSVSEMKVEGKLIVAKGVAPQLKHYLTDKLVEIVPASELPAAQSIAARHVTVPADDADDFEDGDFATDADDFFGDD
jgi:hypothetical protein